MPSALSQRYTTGLRYSLRTDEPGRYFGYSVTLGKGATDNVSDNLTTPVLDDHSTWIVGYNLKRHSADHTGYLMGFTYQNPGGTNDWQCAISMFDNVVQLYRTITDTDGDGNLDHLLICEWSIPFFTPGEWFHLQMMVTISPTSGYTQLIWEGEDMGAYTLLNTSRNSDVVNRFTFMAPNRTSIPNNSDGWSIDDLWICNGDGSEFNGFLGQRVVEAIVPTGTVDNDWTPSSGTAHSCVDEIPAAGNSDDITTSVDGNKTSFSFSNPTYVYDIDAIQITHHTKWSGTGDAKRVKPYLELDGTSYDQDEVTLTKSYDEYHAVLEKNPEGDVSWDHFRFSDIKAGIEKTA